MNRNKVYSRSMDVCRSVYDSGSGWVCGSSSGHFAMFYFSTLNPSIVVWAFCQNDPRLSLLVLLLMTFPHVV